MKTIFTILLIISSLFQIHSQEWAATGTTWTYTYTKFFSPEISFNTIESIGDTIINGQPCKILKALKRACDLPNRGFDIEGHFYSYAENEVVYFYNPEINDFTILYDFSLEVGDSWVSNMPESPFACSNEPHEVFVDSTDIMEINGQNLKVLHVRYIQAGHITNSTIVELLGDLATMFRGYLHDCTLCDGEYDQGLRCFEDEWLGLQEFEGISCDSTWIVNSTKDLSEEIQFEIMPNPATDFLNIFIQSQSDFKDYHFLVYDNLGRLVQEFDYPVAENSLMISLTDFVSGVYFLNLSAEGQILKTEKFVVKK